MCSARTSLAVNRLKKGAPFHPSDEDLSLGALACAAASTAGRPLASSRSTMQTTAATIIPASRAASMALMVEAPVVQTSSTMTTRAPGRLKPSMRRAGAVGLLSFAHQETVQQRSGGIRSRAPCAGSGHVGDDGVRAQGESADGLRINVILLRVARGWRAR